MFESWGRLGKHMKEKHPDSTYFGDSMCFNGKEVVSHKCQICGEDLIEKGEVREEGRYRMKLTKKYKSDVAKALRCAESGKAYHWPTIAAILADEVKRLKTVLSTIEGQKEE